MQRIVGVAILLLFATNASSAELSSKSKGEIDALLNKLGASECQFYRNGSWHSGAEAKDHLKMKLDYLIKKGRIASAEEFIEKAGTNSSSSGQPYKVKCAGGQEQPCAAWLGNELRHIREANHPSGR